MTALTVPALARHKVRDGAAPLVMVTAYDAPGARIADAAGVDLILVGDSVAMVVLGYDDPLQLRTEDIAYHVAAVRRAGPSALVVGDLPWMSYHVSVEESVRNAALLVRAGATCVKLEGGRKRLPMVRAILDAEIPVMGHIGLTPQSVHRMGGHKVQGRERGNAPGARERLLRDGVPAAGAAAARDRHVGRDGDRPGRAAAGAGRAWEFRVVHDGAGRAADCGLRQ